MTDIVIVGAGAAGLTAAYDLIRKSDLLVTVLEAGNVIGGRLRKLPADTNDTLFADFPIDIGGEWIHNEGPGILDRILDNPAIKGEWKTYEYLPDFKIYKNGVFASDNFFEDKGDYHFIDYTWFDYFNNYIAPTSASSVVFGCVVSTIDATTPADQPVTILCKDGRSFRADKVIVAVPLRILQQGSIAFKPPLPQSKIDAMANDIVHVPPGAKLFLKFNKDFYHDAFEMEPTETGQLFFYDAALNQNSGDFILGVLGLGDQAPKAGATPEAFKDSALQILNTMYGGTVASDSFVSFYLQDWTTEPFILGSYSHYNEESGTCDDVIELLREPVAGNRVFFAGEHLPIDVEYGFVHGAALSGRAAAQSVMMSSDGGDGPGGIVGFILAILGLCIA